MQSAETVLGVLRERGRWRGPVSPSGRCSAENGEDPRGCQPCHDAIHHHRHGVITGEPDARKRASPVRREAARKRTRPAGPSPCGPPSRLRRVRPGARRRLTEPAAVRFLPERCDGQPGNASVLINGMNPADRLVGHASVIPHQSPPTNLSVPRTTHAKPSPGHRVPGPPTGNTGTEPSHPGLAHESARHRGWFRGSRVG